MSQAEMKTDIKDLILREFLPDEDPDALTDDIKLVSDGVLDSMASLKLVSFLEEKYGVSIAAHHINADHLDTLDQIVALVESSKG